MIVVLTEMASGVCVMSYGWGIVKNSFYSHCKRSVIVQLLGKTHMNEESDTGNRHTQEQFLNSRSTSQTTSPLPKPHPQKPESRNHFTRHGHEPASLREADASHTSSPPTNIPNPNAHPSPTEPPSTSPPPTPYAQP